MEDQCGNVNVCATEFQTRVENVSKRGKRQLGSLVFRSRTFSPVPPGFPALSGSPPDAKAARHRIEVSAFEISLVLP